MTSFLGMGVAFFALVVAHTFLALMISVIDWGGFWVLLAGYLVMTVLMFSCHVIFREGEGEA